MSAEWDFEHDEDGCFFHVGPFNDHSQLIDSIARTQNERVAALIAAAPDLLEALNGVVVNAEQACFERWLEITTPSGDSESVHAQWLQSGHYFDFCDEWSASLSAIAKAREVKS